MRRVTRALAISIVTFVATAALAQTAADKQRAREAYDRGLAAHERGDHAREAQEFAKADELSPSPVALQAALDAAVEADDPVLGSELLERAKRGPAEGALAASVARAREKLGGRAGRIAIRCPQDVKCLGAIDGKPVDASKPQWVKVGQHTVLLQIGSDGQQRIVEVTADATVEVAPPAPSPPIVVTTPAATPTAPPAAIPSGTSNTTPTVAPTSTPAPTTTSTSSSNKAAVDRSGLPPSYFWIGVGATALFGIGSIAGSLYTKSQHDEFVDSGCERANFSGCSSLSKSGERAQIVTNVALVGTAVVAVATIVLGVGFVNWDHGKPSAFLVPGGGGAGWAQRF